MKHLFRDGGDSYYSQMVYGELTFNEKKPKVTFDTEHVKLKSGYSLSGRGMELSDLTIFNGFLLTVDDRFVVFYFYDVFGLNSEVELLYGAILQFQLKLHSNSF